MVMMAAELNQLLKVAGEILINSVPTQWNKLRLFIYNLAETQQKKKYVEKLHHAEKPWGIQH